MVLGENTFRAGWICISKDPDTTVRADDGYTEIIGESYEWLAKLPHGQEMQVGDVIVLRDSKSVVGFSIIDEITVEDRVRQTNLCPKCNIAKVVERKSKVPRYRCSSCHEEFLLPIIEESILEHRTAYYGAGWVSLAMDDRTIKAWRSFSLTPKSQHSLQPIELKSFIRFSNQFSKLTIAQYESRIPELHGGHKLRTVRTRVGQSAFRKRLIEQFGTNCAITGPNHPFALEAAHLYSYSELGRHHADGGLLLRRDIHHHFDKGLIAINPKTLLIDVHEEILSLEQYKSLHMKRTHVPISSEVSKWLELHWTQYRHK
jgi:hypothetical protein